MYEDRNVVLNVIGGFLFHKQINVSAWFSTGDSRASIGRKSEDTGSVSDKEKDDVDLHHVKSSIVFSWSQMLVRAFHFVQH